MKKAFNRRRGKKQKAPQEKVLAPEPEEEMEESEMVPEKQVPKLTEEELAREYETTYEAKDPNVPPNICHYHYKEKEYKAYKPKNITAQLHMKVHFSMVGTLILKDGEEAKEQNIKDPVEEEKVVKVSAAAQNDFDDIEAKLNAIDQNLEFASAEIKVDQTPEEKKEEEERKKAEEAKAEEERKRKEQEDKKKKDAEELYSKNQFNFSDRSFQTVNNPMRSKEVATKMPPAVKFCRSVYSWNIYDRYVQKAREIVAKRIAAEKKGSRNEKKKKVKQTVLTYHGSDESIARDKILNNPRAKLLSSMLDRIVVQNAKSKAFIKFKYATENDEKDRSGENKKTGRGSFEHLFTCTYYEAKNKTVTALCWNKKYLDMFAVGYGSYEFMPKNSKGLICIFSLKNTAWPQYVFKTNSGVMSIDFHPTYPNLLACGMYDGTVACYDIKSGSGEPIFVADDPKKKHWEPVWQVRWKKTVPGKPNAFTSISSDGRIVDWVMAKTELENVEVMTLKATEILEGEEADDDADAHAIAGGTCFDVSEDGKLYVIGTDEGLLRTYRKNYDTECLEKFQGHHHHVYATRWNKFNSKVFLSASEDWHVKLWHAGCKEPIMSWDLGKPVGDVQWAPYSSTVFACVTDDNTLRVYDLNVDKHEPIGEHVVPKKSKKKSHITHLAFNPKDPVVLVGDERGVVQVFKLSPNLRIMSASSLDKLEPATEAKKLSNVLILDGKMNKVFKKGDVGKRENTKSDEVAE